MTVIDIRGKIDMKKLSILFVCNKFSIMIFAIYKSSIYNSGDFFS